MRVNAEGEHYPGKQDSSSVHTNRHTLGERVRQRGDGGVGGVGGMRRTRARKYPGNPEESRHPGQTAGPAPAGPADGRGSTAGIHAMVTDVLHKNNLDSVFEWDHRVGS